MVPVHQCFWLKMKKEKFTVWPARWKTSPIETGRRGFAPAVPVAANSQQMLRDLARATDEISCLRRFAKSSPRSAGFAGLGWHIWSRTRINRCVPWRGPDRKRLSGESANHVGIYGTRSRPDRHGHPHRPGGNLFNSVKHPDFALWREEACIVVFRSSIGLPLKADNKPLAPAVYSSEPDGFECDLIESIHGAGR